MKKIGYEPERPHYVIGDNYFINELIQKSITENLGSFYLIKHGVEGPDLVTMLMDNAGEEISQMEDAPAPGQALTAEQQASLKQDIVWFVEEDVDGIKVMVPRVYLAPESLKEVKSGQVNGTSTLHAGKHFVSDATEVNNINGNISSGGDVHITAEGDFKNIGAGTNAGINSGGKVTVVSEKGNILNSGAAIDGQGDVTLYAKEGDVNLVASSGFDNNGNQDIGKYKDGISSEQKITIFGENITSHGVDIKASNGVDLVATEGSVNLNEVHEVKSDYNNTMDSKNFLNYRQEVTSSVDANSVTTNIDAGSGGMNIQAEKDIVIEGGKFSAKEGSSLVAGNDITIKTSQDHHASESTVDQKEFVFGAQGNAFGHSGEFEHSGLNGNSSSTSSGEYTSTGSDSTIHTGGKKPGAASSGSAGSFEVGLKKHNEHNTLETTTNTNAQFDMGGDLTIKSGGITDIGGMNANADTLDIIAKEVTSTKYEDTVKETHTVKDSFTGVKGEVHSGLLDAANKAANLAIDSGNGQSLNAGATAAQVAGDMSNLIFGDTVIGGSVSAGHERSTNHSEKYSAKENINNINVNNLNIKTEGDTTLNGVKINVQENTNLDIGGDFEINAAKTTSTEMTSNSSHNAGISVGGGIGATGAGVGASLDYSGNQGGSTTSSTKYDNASIDSNNLTLKTGGDAALTGANLNANNADVDVAGDLSITSVQDTLENHADKQNWGGSLGASISSTGVKPVIEGHGGGGSEYRTERVTGEQSGISTSGDLNVKTGGDLNLTGGHIKSDEKKGSVNIGGDINAITLTDSVEQAGLYGGGGGGFGKKGLPTVNGYVDKVEEKHFKEDQHATIDVGGSITGNIKGISIRMVIIFLPLFRMRL
ncbi:hemagglutinin repeat-containing protein [Pantoea sp. LMR881]|uniref:hemagglutinin repeat-containing protein n=1 Tax=Pantoea sp. LMR881 TaxID=3014336 RepID=UPI0022AE8095|nr:hemagglutinin repeat-containing protein [Pantoea sp. LMR881]MCZ4058972.1 hemagglutinin repeat-containing protein [Pantoea sp. LMR881]